MTCRFKGCQEAGLDDNTSLTTGIQYFIFISTLVRNAIQQHRLKLSSVSEDFNTNSKEESPQQSPTTAGSLHPFGKRVLFRYCSKSPKTDKKKVSFQTLRSYEAPFAQQFPLVWEDNHAPAPRKQRASVISSTPLLHPALPQLTC